MFGVDPDKIIGEFRKKTMVDKISDDFLETLGMNFDNNVFLNMAVTQDGMRTEIDLLGCDGKTYLITIEKEIDTPWVNTLNREETAWYRSVD